MNKKFLEIVTSYKNEILEIFSKTREDDPLSGLKSAETRKKERQSRTRRRIALFAFLIPAIFFFLQVLIKTFNLYYSQFDETQITKNIPKKEVKLEINTFTRWQDQKDKQDEDITNKVDNVAKQVLEVRQEFTKGLADTNANIKADMENLNQNIISTLEKNAEVTKKQLEEVSSQNTEIVKNVEEKFDVKIEDMQKMVSTKLTDIKENGGINSKPSISLPDLPPLSDKNITNIPSNKETIFAKNNNDSLLEEEVIEEEVSISTYGVNSLNTIKAPEKAPEETKMPSFTLMPGFAKGVIVGGADVPTMTASTTEPKPIWISVSSDQLIANNDTTNMKDCLIRGTAVGEIASSRARIVLSELSCSLTDMDGNKYKIIKPVKGVVYSEDGKLGVKGRLVSKEGEIIEKGIPLAAIEGAMSMLSKTDNYILPNGTTAKSQQANPLADFAASGGNSSSKVLQKFSEYYLKILEELNPYIEIKAKRLVTIAFQGGEILTPEKYETFDVDYFEKKEFDENVR